MKYPRASVQHRFQRGVLVLALSGVVASFSAWQIQSALSYTDAQMALVETAQDAQVRELREQEIKQIRIALGRHLPQNRAADLYFRLAEIYLEAYRQQFLLEGRVFEKMRAGGRGPQKMDRSRSRATLELGLKACREILAFRIPYNKTDQVLYFLGFNHNELGHTREAEKAFRELTVRFPQSAYVSEAYRELGELAYNAKKYRDAIEFLGRALRGVPTPMRPRLEHRLAWSYYRTKQFDRAINTMKQAIEHTSQGGEKFLGLKDEALRDMAVFMTESGRVNEALAYFEQVAGSSEYYAKALEQLGSNYDRGAQPGKATQVYEALLKTRPDSEEAFRVLVKLVTLDLKRGQKAQALSRISRASWNQIPYIVSQPESDTELAAANLKAMLRRTATESHQSYRKKSDRTQLQIADIAYSLYLNKALDRDPRGEKPEIQMYLAEVKRELGQSRDASLLYRAVIEGKDVRYAKEAASLWTASLAEAIRKAPSHSQSKLPSGLELEYIEAADQLQESLPGSTPAREARLRAAQVLAGYAETRRDAVERIQTLLKQDPGTPQAVTAARLWLQLVSEHPELGDLALVHETLLSTSALMGVDRKDGGKLALLIGEQKTRSQIAAISRSEKEQDFEKAAAGYEKFADTATDRKVAEKALSNAAGAYLRADSSSAREGVERVYARWAKRFPGSTALRESLREQATFALISGRYELAAQRLEQSARFGSDGETFATASRIYAAIGRNSDFQRTGRQALKLLSSKNQESYELALDLALSEEEEPGQAVAHYGFCANPASRLRAECLVRLAAFYESLRDMEKAERTLRDAAQVQGGSPWVGFARFRLALRSERSPESFGPIRFPEAQLKKGIDSRVQYLEQLSRNYQSVVSAGGPFALSALSRLSSWVAEFAALIDQVDIPAEKSGARSGLQGLAQSLRKRAADTALSALAQAEKAQALSPAMGELDDLAASLGAKTRAQGMVPSLRLSGITADGGVDGRDKALVRVRGELKRNAKNAQAWLDYGNLLWGEGLPRLARIAYDRAVQLQPRFPAAINNRGVVILSEKGADDWAAAYEALEHWKQANRQDEFLAAAKWNRAMLLTYYRLFGQTGTLWEQLSVKSGTADVFDAMGVIATAQGRRDAARSAFTRAQEMGARKNRFARIYHEAASFQFSAKRCNSEVRDLVSELDLDELKGFEKSAAQRFRKECGL